MRQLFPAMEAAGHPAAVVVHAERSMNMNGAPESGIPAAALVNVSADSGIVGFVAKGGNDFGS